MQNQRHTHTRKHVNKQPRKHKETSEQTSQQTHEPYGKQTNIQSNKKNKQETIQQHWQLALKTELYDVISPSISTRRNLQMMSPDPSPQKTWIVHCTVRVSAKQVTSRRLRDRFR